MKQTLEGLRQGYGWSQREISILTGVSQTAIARHENRHDFPADDKKRIARLFALRVDDIEWRDAEALPAVMCLVVGNTGSHDRQEWNVAAYPTREAAEAHVTALKQWTDSRFLGRTAVVADWQTRDAAVQAGCPLDPQFECADNGTDYEIVTTPVMLTAPDAETVIEMSSA